jgi:UDP-glucuronate 4-epimerase
MTVLVTGAAGFIGMHTVERLLDRGEDVIGLDNVNDYYDTSLKRARLAHLQGRPGFTFVLGDIADRATLTEVYAEHAPERVVHLAAQGGVRYSIENPHAYADANLVGFLNVLEGCRNHGVEHLVYASSSSVYGANEQMPFHAEDPVDHPVSLYAATKKANELMAHAYSHLYGMPTTGLRFFTVYGPWGRPDMAPMLFTRSILHNEPIRVFGHGQMSRDFTYIDDIIEGIVRVLDKPAAPDPAFDPGKPDPSVSSAPYRIYNLGNGRPTGLLGFIEALEEELGVKAVKQLCDMEPGDVTTTWADVGALRQTIGFTPDTPIEIGISRFVEWYREFYKV